MSHHVCPWWAGYFIDNRIRRWLHPPERILSPHVRPGMTAMDFGCGMGLFAIALARLVGDQGRVIAVDVQQSMLEVLIERAQKARVAHRIRTHRCEPDSIGFEGAIDFVLAFYCVHEVPDPRRLLGEICSCLRPGGQLLVAEPIGHVPARDFEAMVSLGRDCGLEEAARPCIRLSRAAVFRKPPAGSWRSHEQEA